MRLAVPDNTPRTDEEKIAWIDQQKDILRECLQVYGTEYRRNQFGEDYWVERTAEAIRIDRPDVALISDMRFLNEFGWISRQPQGYTIRMERPGFEVDSPIAAHVSESQLAGLTGSEWSATITAPDGDIEYLKWAAVDTFDRLVA